MVFNSRPEAVTRKFSKRPTTGDSGRPVGVGEVEPGGQMDSGLVLQNLERELTHGLARLQDEALVRVGPLIVRGEGRGRMLQEKPASYARQQERDSKQELG